MVFRKLRMDGQMINNVILKQCTLIFLYFLYIYLWVMLTSALRALVKNLIKKSFDITFMINEKAVKTLIAFFSFPIKTFFN